MQKTIIIITIILSLWSIITTFKAIYLIINKQFNGNKTKWILISMIAFIGPLLWITNGKKLISNK